MSAGTWKRKAGVGAIPLPAPGTSSGVLAASRVAPMGAHSLRGHEGRASRALQKHPQPGTRSLQGPNRIPGTGSARSHAGNPPNHFPRGRTVQLEPNPSQSLLPAPFFPSVPLC